MTVRMEFCCQEPKPLPCCDNWRLVENHPTTDDSARSQKAFSKEAEQLHAHIDPFQHFYFDLLPLIDYQTSTYAVLYVDGEKLNYYKPKYPFGSYSSGEDVAAYIADILAKIYIFYNQQPHENKWKVLKIARRTLPGLQRMIDDYSYSSYYTVFASNLKKQQEQLEIWIADAAFSLNAVADSYLASPQEHTLFDLAALHCDSYPRLTVIELFAKHYGERLAKLAVGRFLSKMDKRISYNQLYGLIFVMAANVRREDLQWKYEADKKEDTPFEELEPGQVDELLCHFRCAPNGQSLLDYFKIKISLDKYGIDPFYLEIFPPLGEEEQGQLNEMHLYADIESTKIWHPGRMLLMTNLQMFDQLNLLFSDPYNPQLFHTDKYISFLNVAATCIAYLQSFEGKAEAVKANLPLLIHKLEEIADNADQMYPEKFSAQYNSHWLQLIGKLKEARANPSLDLTDYYLSLFAHPLLSAKQQKEILALCKELQVYEFLARKVAYWNRHYLSDDKGLQKCQDLLKHREGILFHLSTETGKELFEVKNIILEEGFCCQICTPYNTDKYVAIGKPIPIKLTFQGTIDSALSKKRDLYAGGAGYKLWFSKNIHLVAPELANLMAILRMPYAEENKPTFCLDYIGHSLGGSDAQNAVAYLGKRILSGNKIKEHWIQQINVHTFNTAGVPINTIYLFNCNYMHFREKIGKITHSVVKNDLVSRVQHKLGAKSKPKTEDLWGKKIVIIEVSNLGIYNIVRNHCDYLYSWTDNILPHKKMCRQNDKESIYRYLNSPTAVSGNISDLIEESPLMRIALSITNIGLLLFGSYQFKILGESVLIMSSAVFATAVKMVTTATEQYTEGQINSSIASIWEAIANKWYGTQVLEGTG